MVMSTYFISKLIPGHAILSSDKSALLVILRAHPLLSPTYAHSGTVAEFKEFCAALLWTDSGTFSLAAVKQLPAGARASLCRMFGLNVTPATAGPQSDRIHRYIASKRRVNASQSAARAGGTVQQSTGGGGVGIAPAAHGTAGRVTAAAGAVGGAVTQLPLIAGGGVGGGIGSGVLGAAAAAGGSGSTNAGPGGSASAAGAKLIDGLVAPAQLALIVAMAPPVVRAMVLAAQVPLLSTDSDDEARRKLIVALWAAEVQRTPADMRSLPAVSQGSAMTAIGIDAGWTVGLQDGFMSSTFQLCRQAPWATDPSQSQGLITAERLAYLSLMAKLLAHGGGAADSRTKLAATLSADDFKALEAALTGTGRTFNDITWVGSSWSIKEAGTSLGSPGSVAGTSGFPTFGGSGSALSVGSGFSSVSQQGMVLGQQDAMRALEQQYMTLQFDVYALFTAAESTEFKNRGKFGGAQAGRKRERAYPGAEEQVSMSDNLPIAEFPWNQLLYVQKSFSLSMLGRFLRIALAFCNEHFTDQMTCLVYARFSDEQTKLYASILEAAREDTSAALCVIPQTVTYASRRIKAIRQEAFLRISHFPRSDLFQHVYQQRTTQDIAMDRFTEEVTKRITSEAEDMPAECRAACTVLMWQEFLGGWMATSFDGAYCEDVRSRWTRIKQTGSLDAPSRSARAASGLPSGSGGGGAYTSPKIDGVGSGSGSGGGGGASVGGTAGTGPSPATAQEFRRTIHCAIDIVGDTLGVPSTVPCRRCKPAGRFHSSADCPSRWYKAVGTPLPGFHSDGTRDEDAWRQKKEPIKATIREWIALIKDPSVWNGAVPFQAGVSGAPQLEDFQRQLTLAPEKP